MLCVVLQFLMCFGVRDGRLDLVVVFLVVCFCRVLIVVEVKLVVVSISLWVMY